ncbi:MAG: hypothetical protein CM15mV95_340 [Caudoviricetes sp.]|nr:MAG: hypothetical protein CM15mV95_340 [Caudoviricetes sp.]
MLANAYRYDKLKSKFKKKKSDERYQRVVVPLPQKVQDDESS